MALDLTGFFDRPKDVQYGAKYNISFDNGVLKGIMDTPHNDYFSTFNRQAAFDPNSVNFRGQDFAKRYGLPINSPSGDLLFSNQSSFKNISDAIKKTYGVDFNQFLNMDQGTRQGLFQQKQAGYYSSLFDPSTGLPARPPKTPEEAIEFQFRAGERARQFSEGNLAKSIAGLRFSLGQVSRSSPFSLSTLMSPIFGQMAQTYGAYNPVTPDYSAFLRPDVAGQSLPNAYGGYPDYVSQLAARR